MRKLNLFACAIVAGVTIGGTAGAAGPNSGVLSVDQGRGAVMLDLRGSVLGRLAKGTLRVTDQTPRDRFGAFVVGKSLIEERIGPRTILYRGQGLSFNMLGGGYRIVVRGTGIAVSAVGRGVVSLDGEPRLPGEDTGVYSLDGFNCGIEPENCLPLPDEPERFVLGSPPDETTRPARGGAQ
jgi:hypothetical protein